MKFKEWLLSEEIFPNKTGTVYHRTCQECDEQRSVKSVSGILTKDYRIGDGCKYGCGLYTTFAIESQFNDYMQMYGKAIVQFKVTDLDKYLIFQLSVAKQIHGKDYKISDQLKKLGLPNKVEQSKLKEYDEIQEKVNYSSDLAEEFYKQNDWIVNSVKGIIYYGKKDGYCLLKYPTVQDGTITMLRYAVAEATNMKKMEELKSNIGWIKSLGVLGTNIKDVYNSNKHKDKFAFGDNYIVMNKLLKSKNLEETAKELKLYIDQLNDDNINILLKVATDKDKMAELLIKYKTEISVKNITSLVKFSTDKNKNKIAEIIIEKKLKISDSDIETLLYDAIDRDKIIKLIIKKIPELSEKNVSLLSKSANTNEIFKLIINKKSELSNMDVHILLDASRKLLNPPIDKEEIAKIIINKKPELTDHNVGTLLSDAIDKNKIAELIINKIPELTGNNVSDLLLFATEKDKIAELLGSYNISKLTNDNVYDLLRFKNKQEQQKLVQIINQYHKNITPEIQELLDRYFHEI